MLKLTRRQYMETGILLALVCIFFGWYKDYWPIIIAAGAILLISLILPVIFKPLAFLWFGLAYILSLITSNILLSILFFFLVTSVGLFRRLLGKDSLKLKEFKKSADSVLVERDHTFRASDIKNPF